ncbi:ABC transporter ATP-binding protein/permease [Mycolicibacterium monacense]|uniref:ABC transporter ATP-binding protein/permease n=1 Tax=Mycolicibacterium monacense TaxID=85693 RepID=UPI0007EB6976|nr:ABC transporter ATP-binding protein/permease [Mycolicibacterium monacense]OBF50247.1 multidrug ABC transporter ATP-binding protein [Mycolicibacterium monacense]
MFRPSIDWGSELANSTVWVLGCFLITAPCLLLVLAAVGRFTEWGRQFRRITGRYFTGTQSVPVWAGLAALLLSSIVLVRISVLLSYYANDLFTSLQVAFQGGRDDGSGEQGFWATMLVFVVLAGCFVVRLLADLYLTQRFIMRWRIWLSRNLIDDWLDHHAYYRGRFSRQPVDNPDQRIQQDIDVFTTGVGRQTNNPAYTSDRVLLFGAVQAALSAGAFSVILWQLSGPLTLFGLTLPRALFWIVIAYVVVVTYVAVVVGRPLIRLSYLDEVRNAGFRYALVRLRDAGTAVGMYRGERAEAALLDNRLSAVMTNYRRWLNRTLLFIGWNVSMSQAINPLPFVVQAQRLFAGQISLGGVMQSATAFGVIHDSLSFFRNAYDEFAGYRAATIRLDGLVTENARARSLSRITTDASVTGALCIDGLDVRAPDGRALVEGLDLELPAGETLVIRGESGVGKTVLLQTLAGMWPFATGRVELPVGDAAMFVPQLPYLPLGDLRTVVSYPRHEVRVDDREIQRALVAVALSHLVIRLGEVRDWSQVLSVGEQQRIAFARILLARPTAVFLDESTSALDEGLEAMLYTLLRGELPSATVVSVSHRATVDRFHGHELKLLGDGDWRLARLARAG